MVISTSAITILLENDVSLEMVKEFLGHKNITSTNDLCEDYKHQ